MPSLFRGGLHSPRHGAVTENEDFFTAAACALRLPHPRPDGAADANQWLLIRQVKTCISHIEAVPVSAAL